MQRRTFGREFKVEAVRLIKERGVAVAQAARNLDVYENVLRKWVNELSSDPAQAFPGAGWRLVGHARDGLGLYEFATIQQPASSLWDVPSLEALQPPSRPEPLQTASES